MFICKFFSPLFLKDSFAEYEIQGWHLFSLNTLEVLFHCLLASLVAIEETDVIFLYVFFVADSKIFLCSWCSAVSLLISKHGFLFIFPFRDTLCFFNLSFLRYNVLPTLLKWLRSSFWDRHKAPFWSVFTRAVFKE